MVKTVFSTLPRDRAPNFLSDDARINKATGLMNVTTFPTGHGWGSNASGGGSHDYEDPTDPFYGSTSFRATTDGAGTYKYCQSVPLAATLDFTGKHICFVVRVDDVAVLNELQLFMGDATLANNYHWSGIQGTSPIEWLVENRWATVTLSLADATVNGTPNIAAVDAIRIRFKDNAVKPITVHVGAFFAIGVGTPVLSYSFHGSFASTFTTAREVLDNSITPATAFVSMDKVGGVDALTLDQIRRMHTISGWEIGMEGSGGNMRQWGEGSIRSEIDATLDWATVHRLPMIGFAYPEGQFCTLSSDTGTSVFEIISEYFDYGRTLNQTHQELPAALDPHGLRVIHATNGVTAGTITAAITAAKAKGEWIILAFGDLVTTPTKSAEYSIANFNTITAFVEADGIRVDTIGQIFSEA